MISIDVRSNIKEIQQELNRIQRQQIPFATAAAINKTAFDVRAAQIHEIKDVYDNPTPYTLKFAVEVSRNKATKHNPQRSIYLSQFGGGKGVPAEKYLAATVKGGPRRLKRFERALQAVGALPPGMYAVPGAGAQRDAYGNIKPSQIVQILSYFKAFPEAGYKANMTDAKKKRLAKGSKTKQGIAYFVGAPGDGRAPLGVWARYGFGFGSAIKPVLIFVDSVSYEAIYDFEYVARKTVERRFAPNFREAIAYALRTAR